MKGKSRKRTTIFPLKSLGMVPSTQVPFILFSTLSRSCKTHVHVVNHSLSIRTFSLSNYEGNSPLCRAPVRHVAWSYLVFPTLKEKAQQTVTIAPDEGHFVVSLVYHAFQYLPSILTPANILRTHWDTIFWFSIKLYLIVRKLQI